MLIYNSLTRKKEELEPIKQGRIGMYVCGPTVYDEPHIGHARSAYIFDVIRRYLAYKGYKVKFVRNVTDVDDKIIERARTETRNQSTVTRDLKMSVKEISQKYLRAYHEDMAMLGIAKPTREPRATEYIPKMIRFIGQLIKRGNAYISGGDVYFDIRKAPAYGKLSNQNLERMDAGTRTPSGEKKNDPLDFALWKSAKEDEPSWKSPWGFGRPGWHIECSVMSSDILGDEFDVHGGGIDLIFPHHENEIAQSEGAGKKFARYWIHNGLLTINSEKMAKSLGNFITIKDFISKRKDPDYLKLFFLSAHYRSPIDYTAERIEEVKKEKERFRILLEKIDTLMKSQIPNSKSQINPKSQIPNNKFLDFRARFEEAMDDDFNTPLALASLFDLCTYVNKSMRDKGEFTKDEIALFSVAKSLLLGLSGVLGLNLAKEIGAEDINEGEALGLIEERDRARAQKEFQKSDEIRKRLFDMGIILEDAKDGTKWRRRL